MNGRELALILIVLHVIVCLLIWALTRKGIIKAEGYFFPVMILVPLWGPLLVVLLGIENAIFGRKLAAPTLERLRINDEQYRSILVEGRGQAQSTIPLEEALIVNSSSERRRLVLSILNDSPEDYIGTLQQAKLNDDTEVVHYASTAMSQISKDADIKIQKYEHSYALNQDDPEVLREYSDYLGQYLETGLAEGQAALIQKQQYLSLLRKRFGQREDYAVGCRIAKAQLNLGKYDEADEMLLHLRSKWPTREDAWLLSLSAAALRRDGDGLLKVRQGIKDNNVYLTAKGREALAFWQGETDENGNV